MSSIRLNRQAAHSGQLPQVCICCGGAARQLVRHEFRFEPTWLILLTTVFPKVQMFLSYETFNLNVPVCESHVNRFKWPTFVGLGTAGILFLLLIPIIGLSVTGNQDKLIVVIPIFLLVVLAYVVTRFVLLFGGPRVVAFSADALDLEGVADAFAHHARGGGSFGQTAPQYGTPQAYTGNYGLSEAAYQNAYRPSGGGSSTRTFVIVAVAVGIPVLLLGIMGAAALVVASSPRLKNQRLAAQMRREMNQEIQGMRQEMRTNTMPMPAAAPPASRQPATPVRSSFSPTSTVPSKTVTSNATPDFDNNKFHAGEIVYWEIFGKWYQAIIVRPENPGWHVKYFDESGKMVESLVHAKTLVETSPTGAIKFVGTAKPLTKDSTTAAEENGFEVGDVAYFEWARTWYEVTIVERLGQGSHPFYSFTYYDDHFEREIRSSRPGSSLHRQPPAGAKVVQNPANKSAGDSKESADSNPKAASDGKFKAGDVVYFRLGKWVRGTIVNQLGELFEVRYTDELTKADRTIPLPPELLRRDPPNRSE